MLVFSNSITGRNHGFRRRWCWVRFYRVRYRGWFYRRWCWVRFCWFDIGAGLPDWCWAAQICLWFRYRCLRRYWLVLYRYGPFCSVNFYFIYNKGVFMDYYFISMATTAHNPEPKQGGNTRWRQFNDATFHLPGIPYCIARTFAISKI